MNVIDLSNIRIEGGFFLHSDREQRPFIWPEDQGHAYHFVGTFRDSGSPLRTVLCEMIRSARQRVFIASFMLGDESVIEELLQAAVRLRGGVYVITALDDASLRRGLSEYDTDERCAPEERNKDFERLTVGGISVRGHESCHAKFAVIDGSQALVGSANFVPNSFDRAGEVNLVVRDQPQVQQLARLFTQLWFEGCTKEIPPGLTYVVAKYSPLEPPTRPDETDDSPNQLVWTNGNSSTTLLASIQELIESAASELILSTYSISGMQAHPDLILRPIERAISRGVAVKLLVRQRNAFPSQMKELRALADIGVDVYGDIVNHAKVVIADRARISIFSANFDASWGLTQGVETGCTLRNDPLTAAHVHSYLCHAISTANTTFVRDPTIGELNGRLAARWLNTWPPDFEILVKGGVPVLETLREECTKGPALFEHLDNKQLRIFLGESELDVHSVGGKQTARLNPQPEGIPTTARLERWLRSVRSPQQPRGGFCPAKLVFDHPGV